MRFLSRKCGLYNMKSMFLGVLQLCWCVHDWSAWLVCADMNTQWIFICPLRLACICLFIFVSNYCYSCVFIFIVMDKANQNTLKVKLGTKIIIFKNPEKSEYTVFSSKNNSRRRTFLMNSYNVTFYRDIYSYLLINQLMRPVDIPLCGLALRELHSAWAECCQNIIYCWQKSV